MLFWKLSDVRFFSSVLFPAGGLALFIVLGRNKREKIWPVVIQWALFQRWSAPFYSTTFSKEIHLFRFYLCGMWKGTKTKRYLEHVQVFNSLLTFAHLICVDFVLGERQHTVPPSLLWMRETAHYFTLTTLTSAGIRKYWGCGTGGVRAKPHPARDHKTA